MHPVLACNDDYLAVSTLDNLCLVYTVPVDSTAIAPFLIESKPNADKDVDIEAKGITLHLSFSKSGRYLAICNDYKQLLLYLRPAEGSEWTLVSCRPTAKKGVKVEFVTDESSLIVADKLGAVTAYSVTQPDEEGVVLLGHVSVLLDCLFIANGRYLVTADRDEKIRVSRYPDTFDIQAFCLGHTKYVSCLGEVGRWLASGSGDGTVRLWDPLDGRLLSEVACGDPPTAVQQLIYVPEARKLICSLNGSNKLLQICVTIEGSNASLVEGVTESELSASVIAMCKHSASGLLLLLDRGDTPLELFPVISTDDSASGESLSAISDDLSARWSSLRGAVQCQTDSYADMTKMDLQAMEQGGRKRKHESSCGDGACSLATVTSINGAEAKIGT